MRTLRAFLGIVTVASCCCLTSSQARADVCPAPADAPLVASIDAQERLDYLARAFDEEVYDTNLWSWTLGSAYTVGAVTQAAMIPVFPGHSTNVDLSVGAVSMGAGALLLWGLPLQITLPAPRLPPPLERGGPLRCARARRADAAERAEGPGPGDGHHPAHHQHRGEHRDRADPRRRLRPLEDGAHQRDHRHRARRRERAHAALQPGRRPCALPVGSARQDRGGAAEARVGDRPQRGPQMGGATFALSW